MEILSTLSDHFLTGILVGAVFLGIKVIDWIRKDRATKSVSSASEVAAFREFKEAVYSIKNVVDKIYEMHNVKDADGRYIWYVRQSLEQAIVKLAEVVDRNIKFLDKRNHEIKELIHVTENLKAEIENLTKANNGLKHEFEDLKKEIT